MLNRALLNKGLYFEDVPRRFIQAGSCFKRFRIENFASLRFVDMAGLRTCGLCATS